MKEEDAQKENGKAFEAYNIDIRTDYLNPKYTPPEQG
jgi:hypothetical protein